MSKIDDAAVEVAARAIAKRRWAQHWTESSWEYAQHEEQRCYINVARADAIAALEAYEAHRNRPLCEADVYGNPHPAVPLNDCQGECVAAPDDTHPLSLWGAIEKLQRQIDALRAELDQRLPGKPRTTEP